MRNTKVNKARELKTMRMQDKSPYEENNKKDLEIAPVTNDEFYISVKCMKSIKALGTG